MNFLSHLILAGDDEGLMLGALLGDFVRGRSALAAYPSDVQLGIKLHRHIDQSVDSLPDVVGLRGLFKKPFRRYSGIIIDMAFDHQLANRWADYSSESLESYDLRVRRLLNDHEPLVPSGLKRFMSYADRRGLFASYRNESEILLSLSGIGTRLSRPNPLNRVVEIWPDLLPRFESSFESVFLQVKTDVKEWLAAKR